MHLDGRSYDGTRQFNQDTCFFFHILCVSVVNYFINSAAERLQPYFLSLL